MTSPSDPNAPASRSTVMSAAAGAAPAVFVLVWSTGFLGARYGLPYADPFVLLTVRMVLASLLLALLAVVLRQPMLTSWRQAGWSAIIAVPLHVLYLGGVFWSIDAGLPVSVSALLASMQPVLVAAASGPVLGERVTARQWLGIGLGAIGVLLVLSPGLIHTEGASFPLIAGAAALIALLGGSTATLLQRRVGAGIPMLAGTSVQYLTAAVVLGVAALATEPLVIDWTGAFIGVLAWMVLALSIGAVLLMFWLLRTGSAARFASLYFLVPPVTLIEAYVLFGERLPLIELAGFALAVVGVAVVQRAGRS